MIFRHDAATIHGCQDRNLQLLRKRLHLGMGTGCYGSATHQQNAATGLRQRVDHTI